MADVQAALWVRLDAKPGAKSNELLAKPPAIEKIDVLAAKVSG